MAAATGSVRVVPPEGGLSRGEELAVDPEPARRSRLGLLVGLAAAVLVAGLVTVVLLFDPLGLFAEPGSTEYAGKVEQALVVNIEATGEFAVESVSCPPDLKPARSAPFPCEVTLADGSSLEVVAQLADEGRTVQWSPADA